MNLQNINVGFCITGSFCTFARIIPQVQQLVNMGANVIPVLSQNASTFDTRFYIAKDFIKEIEEITGNKVLKTIVDAEPIGPKKLLDIVIVAPCTGNTLAKLSAGVTDTSVTMAVKAHLRNNRPVVLAISTNDALGNNGKNLGSIINISNIYMVPFGQDNPIGKPNSMVANMEMIPQTIYEALNGKQIQPVIISN